MYLLMQKIHSKLDRVGVSCNRVTYAVYGNTCTWVICVTAKNCGYLIIDKEKVLFSLFA